MNLKNLGSPLSRDEQKQIKGGVLQCENGEYAKCTVGCVENLIASPQTPAAICATQGGTPILVVCYTDSACTII